MPSPLRRYAQPRIGGTGRGEIDRIIFFSDAVFAIAITLLVIQIAVPSARLHGHDLTNALLALGPRYFSFGLSFWVIGRFWFAHHVTFRHVVRWDLRDRTGSDVSTGIYFVRLHVGTKTLTRRVVVVR